MPEYLETIYTQFMNARWPQIPEKDEVQVTGIGSSEIHAKFLSYLRPSFTFKSTENIVRSKSTNND